MWHLAAINPQRLFQSVACTLFKDVYCLWPLLLALLVNMQCVYLQADSEALQMYADDVVASNAVLQHRAEDAEAANATLGKKAQAADEVCSSVQMRLHESQQANKSLRCHLNEQEQVVQVRRQLSLQNKLESCSTIILSPSGSPRLWSELSVVGL